MFERHTKNKQPKLCVGTNHNVLSREYSLRQTKLLPRRL